MFIHFFQFFTRFLAIVVTAAIAIYYLLIVILVMVIVFVAFRWYFLKTAREIKRLESLGLIQDYIMQCKLTAITLFIARSPLYSHISMTLQGLPTIRAYNKQNDLLEMFYKYQNTHSQGWYLYLVTSRYKQISIFYKTISSCRDYPRWFGVRIDMICAMFISLVAFVSIPLTESELHDYFY